MPRRQMPRCRIRFVALLAVFAVLVPSLAPAWIAAAHAQQTSIRQPNSGGSHGGGIGTGIGIGIAVGVIGKLARDAERKKEAERKRARTEPQRKPKPRVTKRPSDDDDDDPPTRKPRRKPTRHADTNDDPPPKPTRPGKPHDRVDLACVSGKTVRGDCRCPAGSVRRVIARVGYFCALILVDGGGRNDPPPPPGTPPRNRGDGPHIVSVPPPAPPLTPRRGASPTPPASIPPALLPPANAFVPDEVLVEIAAGAPPQTEDDLAQVFQLTLIERANLANIGLRLARYRIPDGRTPPQVVASLAADGRAQEPQPNYLYNPQGARTQMADSAYAALQYGLRKISAPQAHRRSTGQGVVVAVIDTGVDGTHPDLKDVIADSYDATDRPATAGTAMAGAAHATAIAGIIAARGVVRGIAPNARLISARAFAASSPQTLHATSYWLLKGLDWAIGKQARVVNMSLAGPREPLLAKAVAGAREKDVIVVAAAGNGGRTAAPAYPAAYPGVIAVTATDPDDRLYARANLGAYIAMAAPGVDIFTLAPDSAHDVQSGTSMAAAHVSGMIALLLQDHPHLSSDAARRAVTTTAVDLGRPGPDEEFGAGRGDADKALTMAAREPRR